MDQANILIIGGGVVGCAIARAVSERWQDVFLVEQFPKLGMATSTRNSGVNHSGIYYPKHSLKARHCVEGNRLTYDFCKKHRVPFRHTGKLVVAANGHEEEELVALKKRGEDNGVEGLRIISPVEIRVREPLSKASPRSTCFHGDCLCRRARARLCSRGHKSGGEHCYARAGCCAGAFRDTIRVG